MGKGDRTDPEPDRKSPNYTGKSVRQGAGNRSPEGERVFVGKVSTEGSGEALMEMRKGEKLGL